MLRYIVSLEFRAKNSIKCWMTDTTASGIWNLEYPFIGRKSYKNWVILLENWPSTTYRPNHKSTVQTFFLSFYKKSMIILCWSVKKAQNIVLFVTGFTFTLVELYLKYNCCTHVQECILTKVCPSNSPSLRTHLSNHICWNLCLVRCQLQELNCLQF